MGWKVEVGGEEKEGERRETVSRRRCCWDLRSRRATLTLHTLHTPAAGDLQNKC